MHEEAGTSAGELGLSGARTHYEAHSICNPPNVTELRCYIGGAMSEVPADVEYRGHRIVWDARQIEGTSFWTGRAAVVSPTDFSGVRSVHKIRVNAYFASERGVRDHFIGVAKEWIDSGREILTQPPSAY